MTTSVIKTKKELQHDDIKHAYDAWGEAGFLYLFDVQKIILLLTGEASLPVLLSNIDGMPSTKTLRRWLNKGTEPRASTLTKYIDSLIQFASNDPEVNQGYCDLFGVPHNFSSLSRQEKQTIIESLKPNIQHPWNEIVMLLKTHGERFQHTSEMIQHLIDAEIKAIEYMQHIISDAGISHIEDISDDILGNAFLEAAQFSFESDGFRSVFNSLFEIFGTSCPKKHNKPLTKIFQQSIDADCPKSILNIIKFFRLQVFGILAGIFQGEYMLDEKNTPTQEEYLIETKSGESRVLQYFPESAIPSDYVAPFGDYPRNNQGRLKKQSELLRKLSTYIRNDYRPFNLFIQYLLKEHRHRKNSLAHLLPGNADLEHKKRKLDKWCQYRSWGDKKGDPYCIKDTWILLDNIEAEHDTRIMFAFMILIDQLYIPEMITLPQKAWKDLSP